MTKVVFEISIETMGHFEPLKVYPLNVCVTCLVDPRYPSVKDRALCLDRSYTCPFRLYLSCFVALLNKFLDKPILTSSISLRHSYGPAVISTLGKETSEINPGFIKNKIREMATSFNQYLKEELKESFKETKNKSTAKNDFLFGYLTDSEMDELFAFAKN